MIIVLKTRNLIYRMVTILSTDGQRQYHNMIGPQKSAAQTIYVLQKEEK